jgi:hypothetical protein
MKRSTSGRLRGLPFREGANATAAEAEDLSKSGYSPAGIRDNPYSQEGSSVLI